jgi:cytochrome oxidase Cu insertion factor (SCO1/SenC/PrrC family)
VEKARRTASRHPKAGAPRGQQSAVARLLTGQLLIPAFVILLIGLAVGLVVYLANRSASPGQSTAPSPSATVPAPSAGAPSPKAVLIGAQAPPFSLNDTSGKAYSLNPGDGKNHLLVFYMGYF